MDPLSLLGVGAQIFGTIMGIGANNRAAKAQSRLDDLRAQQDRLTQVRQGRIKRAQIEQAANNSGSSSSSGAIGGAQAVTTQADSNIAYNYGQESYGQQISQDRQDAATWQGISDIGAGLEKWGGTIQKGATIFGYSIPGYT